MELRPQMAEVCKLKGFNVFVGDFLALSASGQADRIVMNPPFERGQDIDHVRHAYGMLKPGGKLVAVMSEGSFSRNDKKAQEWQQWCYDHPGYHEWGSLAKCFNDNDAFRKTGVTVRLISIEKLS